MKNLSDMTIGENAKDQPPAISVCKRGPGRPKNGEGIDPERVLRDYLEGEHTVAQIGRMHGVSAVTVCNLVARAGVPRRRRGRRVLQEPSERDRAILEAVKLRNFEDVGREYGVSRQRIEQITKRWRDWNPVERDLALRAAACVSPARSKRALKSCIVSFRLTAEEAARLSQYQMSLGLRTSRNPANEAARRIVVRAIGNGTGEAHQPGVYHSYLVVPVYGPPSEVISKMLG